MTDHFFIRRVCPFRGALYLVTRQGQETWRTTTEGVDFKLVTFTSSTTAWQRVDRVLQELAPYRQDVMVYGIGCREVPR